MIFEDRYRQCQACKWHSDCPYSEAYYKNKAEWSRAPDHMKRWVKNANECAHAPFSILTQNPFK